MKHVFTASTCSSLKKNHPGSFIPNLDFFTNWYDHTDYPQTSLELCSNCYQTATRPVELKAPLRDFSGLFSGLNHNSELLVSLNEWQLERLQFEIDMVAEVVCLTNQPSDSALPNRTTYAC